MHNVLLATGRFKDVIDYSQRPLPVASLHDAAAIFGARLVWGEDIFGPLNQTWTYAPPTTPVPASTAAAFLRRLLHSIVYPPTRSSRASMPEHRSVSLVGFMEAVAHFHRLGSIPAHVLVGFLEDTLAEQDARRRTGGGGNSGENDPARLLSCFFELRALCRWYADRGVAPFTLLTTVALCGGSSTEPGAAKEFALTLNLSPYWHMMRQNKQMIVVCMGRYNDPMLGLALVRGAAAKPVASGGGPFGGGNPYGCLLDRAARHARAATTAGGGLASVEVLSCVGWDEGAHEARFLLCADDAAALQEQDVSVVLFRSDSYDVLSMPTKLADARAVAAGVGGEGGSES